MEAKLTLNLPQISETRVATTLDAQNLPGLHSNYKRRSATLELSGKPMKVNKKLLKAALHPFNVLTFRFSRCLRCYSRKCYSSFWKQPRRNYEGMRNPALFLNDIVVTNHSENKFYDFCHKNTSIFVYQLLLGRLA